jgi:hypothetical protein
MFQAEAWDSAPTVGWEKPPIASIKRHFPQFSGIGTLLD